jgi:hypothetical protein
VSVTRPEYLSDRPVNLDEYEILGRRVLVGAPGPSPLREVRSLLRGFGPHSPGGGSLPAYALTIVNGRWRFCSGDLVLPVDHDFESALTMLEWQVVNDALSRRDDLLQLHSAALAVPSSTGGLVVLGQSGSGKSTLTLALMARGFRPFADDVALVEPGELELVPLHRAFRADTGTVERVAAALGEPLAVVEEILPGHVAPAQWASAPTRLRWLLVAERRPSEQATLTPLAPADAAREIMAHALNLSRAPELVVKACAQLTAKVSCYRFVNGDLRGSLSAIESAVSAHTFP